MINDKPINQLIEEFLANHQGKPGTKKKYLDNLAVFVKWLVTNEVDPHKVTRADIILYVNWLRSSGRSEATVVSYIVCVRQFYSYLDDEGLYPNVAKKIKASVKDQVFKKKPLKPCQVTQLLTSINRESLIGKRDYAIINLMVRMGLRCIEVCRLNMTDFVLEEGQWIVRIHRKGREGKDDTQGMTLKVINPIKEYFSQRDHQDNAPAFINHGYHHSKEDYRMDPKSISFIVKQRLRDIGIDDPLISAHSLRHTCAVTAINEGTDIYNVSAMMSHRDIRTTMIYLKYIKEETKKKGIAVHNIDKAY
jgi:site-specific recombinase XerD